MHLSNSSLELEGGGTLSSLYDKINYSPVKLRLDPRYGEPDYIVYVLIDILRAKVCALINKCRRLCRRNGVPKMEGAGKDSIQ